MANSYTAYEGMKGNFRITIVSEVFGELRSDVFYVVTGPKTPEHVTPFARARMKWERKLIRMGVAVWDCGCCIMPESGGGDVKYVCESIEVLS